MTKARWVCLLGFVAALGVLRNDVLPNGAMPNDVLHADEVDEQLAVIAKTGPMGEGSADARLARDFLAEQGIEILPRLLAAMDTTNAVAANWYRTIYEELVSNELARAEPAFPGDVLRAYVLDPSRQGKTRRLVLRLMDRLQPEFRHETVPLLLDDPEFRHDAVAVALAAGDRAKEEGNAELAMQEFRKAFEHARDSSQVTEAASRLAAGGEPGDIVSHLGFVIDWYLLGPFDAPGISGFDLELPPEKQVQLDAAYDGQEGASIGWRLHHADDVMGQLNLIQAIGQAQEAVGYAYTEIVSPRAQRVELRCGADDNCTIWLNGEKVLARRQWLNGTRLDRFIVPVTLEEGTNRILVKVCQGPKHKDPAVPNNWSLQLRICDETGLGLDLRSEFAEAGDKLKPQ